MVLLPAIPQLSYYPIHVHTKSSQIDPHMISWMPNIGIGTTSVIGSIVCIYPLILLCNPLHTCENCKMQVMERLHSWKHNNNTDLQGWRLFSRMTFILTYIFFPQLWQIQTALQSKISKVSYLYCQNFLLYLLSLVNGDLHSKRAAKLLKQMQTF